MSTERILTGITTTGTPHLGNYAGAIRPALALANDQAVEAFYFLADYHALVKCRDAALMHRSTLEVAATWLALGLEPERMIFYRQSDVPEIFELHWILSCLAAKGLMNRAHAYKSRREENLRSGESADPDQAITMGLYSYPVLMAADILAFSADRVPVGQDQLQHVEMARDIAQRFNHHYGDLLALPRAELPVHGRSIEGLDRRKMSKSYGNVIPLFAAPQELRRLVMKIRTNSQAPGEPKDPEQCALFSIYAAFATEHAIAELRTQYAAGIAWKEVKDCVLALLDDLLTEPRRRYRAWLDDGTAVERLLQDGAARARSSAAPLLAQVRDAVGMRSLGGR